MTGIDDDGEAGAAIENGVEDAPKLLVADVVRTAARIRRDDRLVEFVRLVGSRVLHLRSMAGVEEEDDVVLRSRRGKSVRGGEDRVPRRRLIVERDDVARVEAAQQHEELTHGNRVVHRAGEIRPVAVRCSGADRRQP